MLMLQIHLFYHLFSLLSAQYSFNIQHPYLQQVLPNEYQQYNMYIDNQPYHKRYLANNYINQETDSSDDSDDRECKCSCGDCIRPKRCCRKLCKSCKRQNQQSGFVVVPYPVPLVIIPTVTAEQHSTTSTIANNQEETERQTTLSTVSPYVLKDDIIKLRNNNMVHFKSPTNHISNPKEYHDENNNPRMIKLKDDNYRPTIKYPRGEAKTYLLHSMRKFEPNLKHDIIPIPDSLAMEVISQIKQKVN